MIQIQIFTIPLIGGDDELAKMNLFLRSNKIADIRKETVVDAGKSYWSFCITYLPDAIMKTRPIDNVPGKKEKIDYRNVLDEETFAIFVRMRELRKQIAESEAIPPYAIFTDAEMAEVAKIREPKISELEKVPGIGKKKAEKYGAAFVNLLAEILGKTDETGGEFVGEDSRL